ncbi:hypothetical protein P280DRAFT_517111 [Massarina eburnea CBS 473.64]|uniref:Uncharacterized protein n=1 Tax=Massarina eburnea CBS 473.64 TaxID=1395130 RepID=A0A6A6S4A0_9PLEO|nr:hypothetical protein P280DRAFT_517111 [Massarina eburnea CBS 473.64]
MLQSRRDSGGSNVLTAVSDARGPGAALAQLTLLSMRLHPLHSSSQALADNAWSSGGDPNGHAKWSSRQALVVDKDVFGRLMTHVLQDAGGASPGSGSVSSESATLDEILQEVMSGTQQMLKTMATVQQHDQQQSKASNSPLTPVPTPNSSRTSKMGNSSSSPVARHLITSCHGMLVSIYTAIFEVLQRDDASWAYTTGR